MARPLCKWCEKKQSLSSIDYCSLEHLKLDMEYRKINLPKSFLQRLKIRCTPEQRENELIAYAVRHRYDEALVVKKANSLMEQIQ
jgi:hypothetical protein